MNWVLRKLLSAVAMLVLGWLPAGATEAPRYKVVAVDGPAADLMLVVRVESRLTQKDLKDLALDIAESRKKGETVQGIRFYLPRGELSQDPWATAQIEGTTVELNILGLRAEDEAQYRAEAQADTRDISGVWLTSPPALPGKLTILRDAKGGFIAEWHLRSGQKTTDQLILSRSSRGQRYDVLGGDGAYYLATWSGPLVLGDATRIIAYGEKLILEKKPTAPAAVVAQPAKPAVPGTAAQVPADAAYAGQASGTTVNAVAAAPLPSASVSRVRRAKQASGAKPRSSVADLMGSSLSR